jgi:hypothetical protein
MNPVSPQFESLKMKIYKQMNSMIRGNVALGVGQISIEIVRLSAASWWRAFGILEEAAARPLSRN